MKYKYDHIFKLLFEKYEWDKLPLFVSINGKLVKNKLEIGEKNNQWTNLVNAVRQSSVI